MQDAVAEDSVSDALEALVRRCAEKVRITARAMRLPPQAVDELFQEVRIRIWHAVGSVERIDALPASYVYRTAMTAAVDLARRRRARRESDTEDLTLAQDVPDRGSGADVPTTRRELRDGIAQALSRLSESRRAAVRLYLAGYAEREISDMLDWSSAKTRNLLYRGLADLRAYLQALGIGPLEGA